MSWIRRLLGRNRLEGELDREIAYHIERRVADLIEQGLDPREATRRVRLAFGAADQVKEQVRDTWGTRWLEDFARDARHGLRLLCKSPVFTSVAILSLALAIGANTAIFSLMDRVIFRN